MEDWVGRLVRDQAEFKIEGLEYVFPAGLFDILSFMQPFAWDLRNLQKMSPEIYGEYGTSQVVS